MDMAQSFQCLGWTGSIVSTRFWKTLRTRPQNTPAQNSLKEPEIVPLWAMALPPFIHPFFPSHGSQKVIWHRVLSLLTRWCWPSGLASLSFSLSSPKQKWHLSAAPESDCGILESEVSEMPAGGWDMPSVGMNQRGGLKMWLQSLGRPQTPIMAARVWSQGDKTRTWWPWSKQKPH